MNARHFASVAPLAFLLLSAAGGAQGGRTQTVQSPATAATSARLDSLRGDTTRLLAFLREMPKGADLHMHLGGATRAELMIDWAAADGLCFVTSSAVLARPPCQAAGVVPATALVSDSTLRRKALDEWTMLNWHPGTESGADHFF